MSRRVEITCDLCGKKRVHDDTARDGILQLSRSGRGLPFEARATVNDYGILISGSVSVRVDPPSPGGRTGHDVTDACDECLGPIVREQLSLLADHVMKLGGAS